ncbi:MAG: hypothetical protein ACJASQ_004298 [Crocinitomicaceae bacterium]|jgi:hypothetical protein
MQLQCRRCNNIEFFEVPEFGTEERIEMIQLRKESGIKVVKYLIDRHRITHRNAKFITSHLNTDIGQCLRCNNDDLIGENVTCPKCKSLNLNWNLD